MGSRWPRGRASDSGLQGHRSNIWVIQKARCMLNMLWSNVCSSILLVIWPGFKTTRIFIFRKLKIGQSQYSPYPLGAPSLLMNRSFPQSQISQYLWVWSSMLADQKGLVTPTNARRIKGNYLLFYQSVVVLKMMR